MLIKYILINRLFYHSKIQNKTVLVHSISFTSFRSLYTFWERG